MAAFKNHLSSTRVKLLLTGDSGAGKSGVLASLANAGYDLRIIDIDNGLDILNNYLTPEAMDRVHSISIPARDPKTWEMATDLIYNGWKDDTEDLGKVEDWGPECVLVIDSGSFLCQGALTYALSSNKIPLDKMGFDRAIWGVVANKFEELMAKLTDDRRVKCNLVMTAHIRSLEDDRGVSKSHPSFLGQQLPSVVPRYMNNVWRIDVMPDKKRVIRTMSDSKMMLKSSMPKILKEEEVMDLGNIFKRMTAYAQGLRTNDEK